MSFLSHEPVLIQTGNQQNNCCSSEIVSVNETEMTLETKLEQPAPPYGNHTTK